MQANRITDIARELFGIRAAHIFLQERDGSITSKLSETDIAKMLEFFDGDKSSLADYVKWGNQATFHGVAQDKKIFLNIRQHTSAETAHRLLADKDWRDIVTCWAFIKNDSKKWKRFKKDILGALQQFPSYCHARMIHDYVMKVMQKEDKKNTIKLNNVRTLPEHQVTITTETDYQILVPTSEIDLKRIGKAQGHCVGTHGMGYADKIKRGDVVIFAMYKKTLYDGICVEYSLKERRFLQVQGKYRREATQDEMNILNFYLSITTGSLD